MKFSIISLWFEPDTIRLWPPAKDSALNEFSTSPKGECRKMSTALNSAIDGRSCSTCADAHSSELIARNEFDVPVTQALPEVRSVCGSDTVESAASVAGLSFLSSYGATCSGSKARAVIGAIS